jgi:hypothetical protein
MAAPTLAPADARNVLASDPQIGRRLLAYAHKKTRDRTRTLEIAQEAITRVLEGHGFCRWAPERKGLFGHLADVVDSLVANQARRDAVWREQPMTEEDEERQVDSSPSPEQRIDAIEELERKRRLVRAVLARVAQDRIITGMLERQQAGVDKASELAELLHCSAQDIYRARERLAYHRHQVLEEDRRNDPQRTKGRATSR